jgi:hypothetical protein
MQAAVVGRSTKDENGSHRSWVDIRVGDQGAIFWF